MKTSLFERIAEATRPQEEKSGIELLEELANSHCENCGSNLDNNKYYDEDKYCKDCSYSFFLEENNFQSQREK